MPKSTKGGFRCNAASIFLTYAQCDVTKEQALEFFTTTHRDHADITWGVFASERHEDGGFHLHVQVVYGRKLNIRDPAYFDIQADLEDGEQVVFHPNFSGSRNLKAVGEYCTKDGDYVLHGVDEEGFRKMLEGGTKKNKYDEVLEATSYEEACEVVKRIDPRMWVNNGDRIRANLQHDFVPKFPEYVTILPYLLIY